MDCGGREPVNIGFLARFRRHSVFFSFQVKWFPGASHRAPVSTHSVVRSSHSVISSQTSNINCQGLLCFVKTIEFQNLFSMVENHGISFFSIKSWVIMEKWQLGTWKYFKRYFPILDFHLASQCRYCIFEIDFLMSISYPLNFQSGHTTIHRCSVSPWAALFKKISVPVDHSYDSRSARQWLNSCNFYFQNYC